IFFKGLLALVDMIVPGPVDQNTITTHIAMLHTVFNTVNTLIFLPFVNQIAALTERLVKPKQDETPDVYHLEMPQPGKTEHAAGAILLVEKEIADMTEVVTRMFQRIRSTFADRTTAATEAFKLAQVQDEDYADQMHHEISQYLVHCMDLPLTDNQRNNVSQMLEVVAQLESMTDDCHSVSLLLFRSVEKNMTFAQEDLDRLDPYVELVNRFVLFIRDNINRHLSEDKLSQAKTIEDQIDLFRKNLKKVARKRLESGADVKSELLYIDLVRQLEKIGDRAFSISEALYLTK
ncbi:MAG: Na/Pi cotransporter family protein, partial [Spirochaetaceae bacterium]|nr:Na/Pi cotransporter family protein [Spirochaetaceae bacterium]